MMQLWAIKNEMGAFFQCWSGVIGKAYFVSLDDTLDDVQKIAIHNGKPEGGLLEDNLSALRAVGYKVEPVLLGELK